MGGGRCWWQATARGGPGRGLRVGQRGPARGGTAGGRFGNAGGGGFLLINDKAFLALIKGHVGKAVERCRTRRGDFPRAFHGLLLPRSARRIFAACDIPVGARARVRLRGAQTREARTVPVILHLSVRGTPGLTPDDWSTGSLHRCFPVSPPSRLVSAGRGSRGACVALEAILDFSVKLGKAFKKILTIEKN